VKLSICGLPKGSDMFHRMFFDPLPKCFVHSGLPSFTRGLEGGQDVQVKADGLRSFRLAGRTTSADKLGALHKGQLFQTKYQLILVHHQDQLRCFL